MLRLIIILLASVAALAHASAATSAVDSLLAELDRVIEQRPEIMVRKERQLTRLTEAAEAAATDDERFARLGDLYDAYCPYNTDSAFAISLRREAVARRTARPELIHNARMNRAGIMCATGLYKEALDIMDSIPYAELPQYLRPYYHHIKRTAYGLMADYSPYAPVKERYTRLTEAYRDSLLAVNPEGSLSHAITLADRLNARGDYTGAISVMERFMAANTLSEHENAICAWTLSEAYRHLGDTQAQKRLLLTSAISDMKSAVREYVSLRQLALLLYSEGDLKRAYAYLSIAVDDAAKCHASQRIIELNDSYPMVNAIYIDTINGQRHKLMRMLALITLLSLILVAALLFMRRQMKQLARSRKAIAQANDSLNRLNDELKRYNARLSDANRAIAENSQLKEVYIGRYMDQCLSYIEKLDTYRKTLSKLATAGKHDELARRLKAPGMVDEELRAFYDNFDRTFLSMFPTFVDDFNALLLPGEAIVPKKPGTLSTELRIYALVRLGIADSDRIAKFLRYSVTTIYNYRTRLRNKAAGDRTRLEADVMRIGSSQQ